MKLLFVFSLSFAVFAQPPTSAPVLPSLWMGAGAAFNSAATPQVNGWFSYAQLLSQKQQIYSFSTHDITPLRVAGKLTIQDSTRTGFAIVVRQFGPLTTLGLCDAGIAATGTASGTSVSSAFSGGALAVYQIGKTDWTLEAGYRLLKTTSSQNVYEFGFGRTSK
jgi:hypothetical protein